MRSEVQVLLDPPSSSGAFPLSADFLRKSPAGLAAPQFAMANFGALAQLGERLICIQEVSGSIPLGSTTLHFACKVQVPRFIQKEASVAFACKSARERLSGCLTSSI